MIDDSSIENPSLTDIAIIGMSCRFPGANNLDEFWENLIQGKETISRFTNDELLAGGETEEMINRNNYVNARGIVADPELFDASFFGFSALDAKILDPQQRLFIECGWDALEAAGYTSEKYKGLIGVYASMAESTYLQNNILKNNEIMQSVDGIEVRIATSLTTLSTQFSYRLNLKGPSINLTTACSSSLVAIASACKALLNYDCDLAVAGASVVSIPQKRGYLHQKGGIESADGHCRAFDAEASGTVFSDGVGIVILKRLSDAIEDKDFIYATIKGWNINNDGSEKIGYTAPSVQGQAHCIVSAANFANLDLETVSYIETHGTATAMGDPIEIKAMKMAFETQTNKKQFCAIGSVKTNMGHADIAAGMASVIKTTLALKHATLPASLHFKKSNPAIDFSQTPFYVNDKLTTWDLPDSVKRRAGVNSSGIGGTNAFLLLEEYSMPVAEKKVTRPYLLIPFSAKTTNALEKINQQLLQFLKINDDNLRLSDVAYTLQVGRADFNFRQAIVLPKDTTIQSLENFSSADILFNKTNQIIDPAKTVFLFTGQGSQYAGMCAELYRSEPDFAKIIDDCINCLDTEVIKDVRYLLFDLGKSDTNLNDTLVTQPALFIFEYALAKFLMMLGIIPAAMVGHSLGEYVAACLAGVIDYKTAINLIQMRARLMNSTKPGSMLAVELNEQEISKFIQDDPVSVAAYNSLANTVISGQIEVINCLEEKFIKNNIRVNRLNTSHAFHSSMMEPILEDFYHAVEKINLRNPLIPFLSNVTGEWIRDHEATNPRYWVDHLRNTVRFADNLQRLLDEGFNVFLEIGPGRTLTNFVRELSKNKANLLIRNINNRYPDKKSNTLQFFVVLAELWLWGMKIDWNYFNKNDSLSRIPLPTYPFNRQHFWISPSIVRGNLLNDQKQTYENWFYELSWKRASSIGINNQDFKEFNGCWIILADGFGVGQLIQESLLQKEQVVFRVSEGTSFAKISVNEYKLDVKNKEHYSLLIHSILSETDLPLYIINLLPLLQIDNMSSYDKVKIDTCLDYSFYAPLFIVQALVEKQFTNSVHITLVSNQLFSVFGESVFPAKSTLTGPCRIIPIEHENIKMQAIDVPLEDLFSQYQQDSLVQQIITDTVSMCLNENFIAYRKNYKWMQTVINTKLNDNSNLKLGKNSVYLLTGGLGGISLTLAAHIADHSINPTFIFLSRSKFPTREDWLSWLQNHDADDRTSKKIRALLAIEDKGAAMHFYQVNIADDLNLPNVIRSIKNKFGKIHGVIHSAGNPGGGLAQFKTKEMAAKVFEPKIYGTYLLCSLLKDEPLDFFILCSSISSIVGEASQVDYCSANACLDAFPYSSLFAKSSTLFTTINWNTWQEVGMAVDTERPSDISYFDRKNDIQPDEGAKIFLDVLSSKQKQVVVSTMSLECFIEQMRLHGTGKIGVTDLVERDTILPPETKYQPPHNPIESQLVNLWQEVFSIDKIGITDDFFALGGHSLTALHLLSKIERQFKVTINMTTFLEEATTIKKLAELILSSSKSFESPSIVIPIRSQGSQKPLFCFHPVAGTIFCYSQLAKHLRYDAPIYGVQDPSISHDKLLFSSLEEMAGFYLKEIKKVQPHGPYYLAGLSFGATLSAEIARQLRQDGETIKLLIFFDGWAKFSDSHNIEAIFKKSIEEVFGNRPDSKKIIELVWQRMQLLLNYELQPIQETVVLFKAETLLSEYTDIDDKYNYWKNHISGNLHLFKAPGDHETILDEPNVEKLAAILDDFLTKKAVES